MYSVQCINHEAAEEVLTVLERYGYKGHIDGKEIKTDDEITDDCVVAEIFPWKAHRTTDEDGTYYD